LIEPPDLRFGGENGTELGFNGGFFPGWGRGGDRSGIGGEPIEKEERGEGKERKLSEMEESEEGGARLR